MSSRSLTKERSDKTLTQTGYSSPNKEKSKANEINGSIDDTEETNGTLSKKNSDRSMGSKSNSAGKLVRGSSDKNFNEDGTSNRPLNRDGSARSIGKEKSIRFNKEEHVSKSPSSKSTFIPAENLDAMIKTVSSRDLISSDEIDDFILDIENNLSKEETKSNTTNRNSSPRKTVKNSASRETLLDGTHNFDRHGFLIAKPNAEDFVLSSEDQKKALDKEDERTDKWIYMLNHWDTFFLRKFSKVKSRVRKGIPHAIRGKSCSHSNKNVPYRTHHIPILQ